MKPSPASVLKPIGPLAFLATAIVGWKLATPATAVISRADEGTKRSKHTPRSSRSLAADSARTRIGNLRAIADPEARMLATISLANSLSPSEFAAWMDGKWFSLRGGPEHLLFDRILMERWRNEDPEGLLAWSTKNRNRAADSIVSDWAVHEPQRLLEFYKTHRDDPSELSALARIAGNSPQIALARLQEMVAGGIIGRSEDLSDGVLRTLLDKSPTALLAALGTLPPEMKLTVDGFMSRKRLDESFSDEIRNLWDKPDGWQIFSKSSFTPAITDKLLGELANLPPEWRSAISTNPWRLLNGSNPEKWCDADLESAGFSPDSARSIRLQALNSMSFNSPEGAINRLVKMDVEPSERARLLNQALHFARDPEKLRALIPSLTNDADREAVASRLDVLTAPKPEVKPSAPQDFLEALAKSSPGENGTAGYLSEIQSWDSQKISEFTTRFKNLSGEQKQQVAQVIVSTTTRLSDTSTLKGDALRYLLENPPPKKENADPWESSNAAVGSYAVNLSNQDPAAATAWVASLPDGEDKAWTQKNLYNNWKQYDPKAADQWFKSLPVATQTHVQNLTQK